MKKLIIILLSVFSLSAVNVQGKIKGYNALMMTKPTSKKATATEFNYDGAEVTRQQRIIRHTRLKQKNRLVARVIDRMRLIDYKSDTVFIITSISVPSSFSYTIKTQKGEYAIRGDGIVEPLANRYDKTRYEFSSSLEEKRISESTLYHTLYTWDIDLFSRLIKSSGVDPFCFGNRMYATRIILKDYQIIEEQYYFFDSIWSWHF